VQGLDAACAALLPAGAPHGSIERDVRGFTAMIRSEGLRLHARVVGLEAVYGHEAQRSAELLSLAEDYSALHAAAACIQLWLHNRSHLGELFARGEWLVLCLSRVLSRFPSARWGMPRSYRANLARELARLSEADESFSLIPLALGRGREQQEDGGASSEPR
jgi:hypothetical protein